MTPESLFQRLARDVSPSEEQKKDIRARMLRRMDAPSLLEQAMKEATPSSTQHANVWSSVLHRIDLPVVSTLFDRIRGMLQPSNDRKIAIRMQLMPRLIPEHVSSSYRISKWAAAFVLVIVALRASPALFLAPHSIADSAVMVMPTQGNVMLSAHGLWQTLTEDVTLSEGMTLKTAQGEATIIVHDDGTIRFAPHTEGTLNDVTNRPEPTLEGPTLTLTQGEIWLQGLLPGHLRGISVETSHGVITVHGGSVSIAVGDAVTVRVWDRHAEVTYDGTETTLFAGDQVQLGRDNTLRVRSIAAKEYKNAWVTQNLQRDAVHQREIAQMQQERRAAAAGISPTSRLYPAKRLAEKVDVLLTLDPEARVQKKLDQATTRLNEAAALIAEGQSGTTLLAEYTQAISAIATGSGDVMTQRLVALEVANNTADLSAALPNNHFYVLKKTVLESSADLPEEVVDEADVQGMLLVDTIDVLKEAIETGDTARAQETYDAIQPYLSSLEKDNGLKPEVKKEALALLTEVAEFLQETSAGEEPSVLSVKLSPYLPQEVQPTQQSLTEEQKQAMVAQIKADIYEYTLDRPRWNVLMNWLRTLKGHSDEGSILRLLYDELLKDSPLYHETVPLHQYVRSAIQDLRERQELR